MKVSIIIVNYNTKELTQNCIDSILDKTKGIDYEIIVVDNASTDGSKQIFETNINIKYIYNNENVGFGRANNIGYNSSVGEYIFLLNSDTILVNNAIKILSEFLDSHDTYALAGGQLLSKELIPIHSYSLLFPSITWELNNLLHKVIERKIKRKNDIIIAQKNYVQVAYITGADLMIRRKDVELLGLFNPNYFMYFEETEMTYRFRCNNKFAYFVPEARIIHLENASFKVKTTREKMFLSSRKRYYLQFHSSIYYYCANIIYILTCISKICAYIPQKDKCKFWKEKLMVFIGIK